MDAEDTLQLESDNFRLSEAYATHNGQDIVGRSYCEGSAIYYIEEKSVMSDRSQRILLPTTLKEFFVTEEGSVKLESGRIEDQSLFGECSVCSGSHTTERQVLIINSFNAFHTDCFEELSRLIHRYITSYQERFLVHGL